MIKVAINGFGRIGRATARHILESRPDMQLVKINATGDLDTNLHFLKFDSVHGRFAPPYYPEWSHTRSLAELDWTGIDVVLECTGAFNNGEACKVHLQKGARKVVISAPAKNVTRTIVYGVNHNTITANDNIVSNASCTTNCLAPLARVLHNTVGIQSGIVTTIHAYTGDQLTHDKAHTDLYRARAAGVSMIPTSTGAASAIGDVIPALRGKLDGSAIRVPTPNVSCVDMTFVAQRETIKEEINTIVHQASLEMPTVLGYEPQPLVSIDFNHTSESSIFAPDQTKVIGGNLVRVLAWYDNEWGFSCRMADTASVLAKY
jgi:glyceraldehyde 3-phosphate dehydrogenase